MVKLRVLIVDDDDVVRALLAKLVVDAGHEVHELPSAIGVTRVILQQQIDVVAIDIMMPTLPGDKLTALLRQNPRLKKLAVVLVSSRPAAELEQLAAQVGAEAVVTKAQARETFVAAVARAAKRRLNSP